MGGGWLYWVFGVETRMGARWRRLCLGLEDHPHELRVLTCRCVGMGGGWLYWVFGVGTGFALVGLG